jgi:hypothetical protein
MRKNSRKKLIEKGFGLLDAQPSQRALKEKQSGSRSRKKVYSVFIH